MNNSSGSKNISWRVSLWYACLLICLAIFILRLFYVQIIKHDSYKRAASNTQFRERQIPAERGVIEVRNGDEKVPLVLNEKKYTVFADPKYIISPDDTANKLQSLLGGNAEDIKNKLIADSRYQILAKKLDKSTKQKVESLKLKGILTREENYRTYPQGLLAAQLIGFVNDEGEGNYGIEQALDEELRGRPGELKAITDAAGIPLVANKENTITDPLPGARVGLTIDIGLQKRSEEILKQGLEAAKSKSGSLLIMDPNTGAVRAMANYPTYNPAEFYNEQNADVFNNAIVSAPMEVGSIIKPLVVAAGLDQGVINRNWSYFDNGTLTIDGATIKNVRPNYGVTILDDVLRYSLNTGSTRILMQMGGGELNEQARTRWYEYLTNHFLFGKATGIEQGHEEAGSVPSPTGGFGLDIQYANTTFGQGMNITILQVASAFSAVINGGTYYRPHLVEQVTYSDGRVDKKKLEIIQSQVVSADAGDIVKEIMIKVVESTNQAAMRPGYSVGGKTGTAQIAKPEGGYYDDKINGTYIGFIGGDAPEYVVVVRVNEPGISGLAGSRAAAPIFADVSKMLIDSFGVTPRSK